MINTIEEFSKLHPLADIVNYDIAEKFGYGMTYRTKTKTTEKFRMHNNRYLEYPFIQPYLEAKDIEGYEFFIIKDGKMYQIMKDEEHENSYKKIKEIEGVSPEIYNDDVFYQKRKEPKCVHEEICKIID